MDLIRIDDASDPRIAAYLNVKDRDLRGRDNLFIAEGKVVLATMLAARRFEVQSVLLLENRLEGMRVVLATLPVGVPAYVASQDVMDAIAGFHLHRGILAVGKRPERGGMVGELDRLPPQALVVVMVGIANHDNVGGIFRNAAAFGADLVLFDESCCDPLYRKAIRVSVGAALKVPFASAGNVAELIRELDRRGFAQFALSPSGNTSLKNAPGSDRLALYLGTEGEGLPRNVLDRLTTLKIEMAPGFDSLNVASASAVALHHFMKD